MIRKMPSERTASFLENKLLFAVIYASIYP